MIKTVGPVSITLDYSEDDNQIQKKINTEVNGLLIYIALVVPVLTSGTASILLQHPVLGDGTDYVWVPASELGATLAANDIHEKKYVTGAGLYLPAHAFSAGDSTSGVGVMAQIGTSAAQDADREFSLTLGIWVP